MKNYLLLIISVLLLTACKGKVPDYQIVYGAEQCEKHDGLKAFIADSANPGRGNEALCDDGVRIDLDLAKKPE